MKFTLGIVVLIGMVGCEAPLQITSAPEPSYQELATSRAIQSREITVSSDLIMPKILEILYDAGYLVRSANSELGLVSFCQQRYDRQQIKSITMEGSAIFKSGGPNSTKVRVILSGNWEGTSIGGGMKSTVISSIGGVQEVEQDEYKKLLDLFETKLHNVQN